MVQILKPQTWPLEVEADQCLQPEFTGHSSPTEVRNISSGVTGRKNTERNLEGREAVFMHLATKTSFCNK